MKKININWDYYTNKNIKCNRTDLLAQIAELYNNLKDLGLLYDDRLNDETVFEHLHYAANKRRPDQADQAYNAKWGEDEITWNKRKLLPVEKRIEI